MDANMVQTLLIVVTLAVAGFALYRSYQSGKSVTMTSLVETIKSSAPVAQELMEIAQIAVNSVEQLRREGKITDNDIAFNRALDLTKKWIPDEWKVDNSDIINSINAAILVASSLSKQAGKSSENATN